MMVGNAKSDEVSFQEVNGRRVPRCLTAQRIIQVLLDQSLDAIYSRCYRLRYSFVARWLLFSSGPGDSETIPWHLQNR